MHKIDLVLHYLLIHAKFEIHKQWLRVLAKNGNTIDTTKKIDRTPVQTIVLVPQSPHFLFLSIFTKNIQKNACGRL